MSDFHNPYQFIPVHTKDVQATVTYKSISDLKRDSNRFVRHDFFHQDSLTGKVQCKLKTLSATVVGSTQHPVKGEPSIVDPYTVKSDASINPAIPGSTIRGVVSNIVEIISQSSMRVMSNTEDGDLSVRKPARGGTGHDRALSELGVLLKISDKWKIFPLGEGVSVGNYKDTSDQDTHATNINQNDCFQLILNDHRTALNGFYYIRGSLSEGTERAPNKIRETFFAADKLTHIEDSRHHLEVESHAISVCEKILRERYKQTVKADSDHKNCNLLPKGYRDDDNNRGWKENTDLVCHGDLIYYRTDGPTVVEVGYSAIWRRQVPGNLQQAFTTQCGANSTPWNEDRSDLTPAEALFGVTEERDPTKFYEEDARNLASRLRFYDAIAPTSVKLHESVVLKSLASPKPPSPALYFCADGKLREKTELDLKKDTPNGRKYYLPHPRSLLLEKFEEGDWKTQSKQRPHLKLSCKPIPKDEEFTCEIQFDNLSVAELGLLITALQPNGVNDLFIHRIGLGKPLGLGHITVKDIKVQVVDRYKLYTSLPIENQPDSFPYTTWTHAPDTSLIDKKTLQTLNNLADPKNIGDLPVCYPYSTSTGQHPYNEEDGYQWFSRKQQALTRDPTAGTQIMKPLKSN